MGQLAFASEIPAIQDRFIRREANKAGNRKALRELALKGRSVHEKWVFKFGGELYGATSFWPLLWTGLRAPLKRTVWFEHSAHFPFFEEPLKFAQEMQKVLDETYRD
jgi:pimeloyl-ACP methyl ester carboxylesterase